MAFEASEEEKIELDKGIDILVEADYISINYNQNMTIEDAYNYLKKNR